MCTCATIRKCMTAEISKNKILLIMYYSFKKYHQRHSKILKDSCAFGTSISTCAHLFKCTDCTMVQLPTIVYLHLGTSIGDLWGNMYLSPKFHTSQTEN